MTLAVMIFTLGETYTSVVSALFLDDIREYPAAPDLVVEKSYFVFN